MAKAILILGATSSIARAAALAFADKGYSLFLAGRNVKELERIEQDIQLRAKVDVKSGFFDADHLTSHKQFLERVIEQMNGLTGVLLAFGDLGDHQKALHDEEELLQIITRNYTGACSILTYCANYLASAKSGFIIGISSVAGDRGRQSNYIYGSAKGGLSLFLQGLRNRLYPDNVRVITVKPGYVDTAMTFDIPKKLFLNASPDYIGKKIAKSPQGFFDIIYLPWYWRWIMLIIKCIPEIIFKRLKM